MNKANILPAAANAELNEEHFWLTKANNKTGLWDCPRIMSYVFALCLLCFQSEQKVGNQRLSCKSVHTNQ